MELDTRVAGIRQDAGRRRLNGRNILLSAIIPWSNRPDLQKALAGNESWLRSQFVEIIIVNCAGDRLALKQLLHQKWFAPITHVELPAPRFNRSLALNIGLFVSTAPTVFILDADIILQCDPLANLLPLVTSEAYVSIEQVLESELPTCWWKGPDALGSSVNFIRSIEETRTFEFGWADGTTTKITEFASNHCTGCRAVTGLIMVDRDQLRSINGYNSSLELWGWEDNDLELRLAKQFSLNRVASGRAIHLSHSDAMRAVGNKTMAQSNWDNLVTVCRKYSQGDFQGTYSSDVAAWWPHTTVVVEADSETRR